MIESRPIHVVPLNDLRTHDTENGLDCWCRPTLPEPGVIVHNSMDRREEYEQWRLMS